MEWTAGHRIAATDRRAVESSGRGGVSDDDTHRHSRTAFMNFHIVVALSAAATLIVLALIHLYWAVGGAVGRMAAVPMRANGTPVIRPGPAATLAVAVGLAGVAIAVLVRVQLIPEVGPPALYRWGARAAGVAFALRVIGEFRYVGLFKRVRGTRFARWDGALYTPLCAALSAAILYLAAI